MHVNWFSKSTFLKIHFQSVELRVSLSGSCPGEALSSICTMTEPDSQPQEPRSQPQSSAVSPGARPSAPPQLYVMPGSLRLGIVAICKGVCCSSCSSPCFPSEDSLSATLLPPLLTDAQCLPQFTFLTLKLGFGFSFNLGNLGWNIVKIKSGNFKKNYFL